MSKFRFVEHPPGRWRVEEKGWFFWSDVVFYGYPVRCYREPVLPPLGMVPMACPARVFDSLGDAKRALADALANRQYRRVVNADEMS